MPNMIVVTCDYCRKQFERLPGEVKYRKKVCAHTYCSQACSGMARRAEPKGPEVRKAEKAEYDRNRRALLAERLKSERARHYANKVATDPTFRERERERRKQRMPRHLEYCRSEHYRQYKKDYDANYRAKEYGDFAEAYRVLVSLTKEINGQQKSVERHLAKGTFNKSLQRKRHYARLNSQQP